MDIKMSVYNIKILYAINCHTKYLHFEKVADF